jgi:hypothetical protein
MIYKEIVGSIYICTKIRDYIKKKVNTAGYVLSIMISKHK